MFFWNSLAFSMIQQMLAIWSLIPLPFLKPTWSSGSSRFMYCWSLAWRMLSISHSVRSNSLWPPWTGVHQASLSFTVSRSLLKLMSIESMMPSNNLILCAPFSSCPWSFQASGSFPVSQLFSSGGQSIRASSSASVLPMNIQGWFPLGLTGFISLQS